MLRRARTPHHNTTIMHIIERHTITYPCYCRDLSGTAYMRRTFFQSLLLQRVLTVAFHCRQPAATPSKQANLIKQNGSPTRTELNNFMGAPITTRVVKRCYYPSVVFQQPPTNLLSAVITS